MHHYQFSILNFQFSIINYQLSIEQQLSLTLTLSFIILRCKGNHFHTYMFENQHKITPKKVKNLANARISQRKSTINTAISEKKM